MTNPISIQSKADTIDQYFSPKIIAEVNNEYVKLAKIKGEDIPWHNHANEDELFFVVSGKLFMEIENQTPFELNAGELCVVKKGVEHRVSSVNECLVMLIESKTTKHTGDVASPITRSIEDQLK